MTSIADFSYIDEEQKSRLRYTIGHSLKSYYVLNGKSLAQVDILSKKKYSKEIISSMLSDRSYNNNNNNKK